MSFGPSVTALTAAQMDATTLVLASKAGGQNEIASNVLLDALLRLSADGFAVAPITPAQITADTHNWARGVGYQAVITSNASRSITGEVAGVNGEIREDWNIGSFPIIINNENANSTAANRYSCAGGVNINIGPGELFRRVYLTSAARWLATKVRSDASQGALIVRQPGGTVGEDELQIVDDGDQTFISRRVFNGGRGIRLTNSEVTLSDGDQTAYLTFDANTQLNTRHGLGIKNDGSATIQGGIVAVAAGVMAPAGSCTLARANTAGGWFQNTAGRARVTADVTNATTTFASLTDLTITLIAGRKYFGRLLIKCNDSTAGEGIKFDFNGGSATMTAFWAAISIQQNAGLPMLGTGISTSLAGVLNYSSITGEAILAVDFSMVVNAGGTFIPRFAQDSHAVGTATFELGSFLSLEDSPN